MKDEQLIERVWWRRRRFPWGIAGILTVALAIAIALILLYHHRLRSAYEAGYDAAWTEAAQHYMAMEKSRADIFASLGFCQRAKTLWDWGQCTAADD